MALPSSPFDLCEAIRGSVLAALDACPESAPISTSYTGVGLVAWDDCCGQLVVTPNRTFRYAEFPIEQGTDERCAEFLAVDVQVSLVRCVPTLSDGGQPPTSAALEAAHRRVLDDAVIVWDACAASPIVPGWDEVDRALLAQTIEGAEGGCVSILTTFTLGLPVEEWCWTCG